MQFIEDIGLKDFKFTDEAFNYCRRYFDDYRMSKIESALQNDFCEILTSNTINQMFCHDREYLCFSANYLIYPIAVYGFIPAKNKTISFLENCLKHSKSKKEISVSFLKNCFKKIFIEEYSQEQKGYLTNLIDRLIDDIFERLEIRLNLHNFYDNKDRISFILDYFEMLDLSDFGIYD